MEMSECEKKGGTSTLIRLQMTNVVRVGKISEYVKLHGFKEYSNRYNTSIKGWQAGR